jgi:integrase
MRIKQIHENGCVNAKGKCGCPWRLDFRPQGLHGPRHRMVFKTKRAAEEHYAETASRARKGEYIAPEQIPDFAKVAEDWYASKAGRRPSHLVDLRGRLDKHILSRKLHRGGCATRVCSCATLGETRLDRITVADLQALRDDLVKKDYAPRTVNTILRIVKAVFRFAINRDQCVKNPADRVERAFMAARELKAGDSAPSADDAISPDSVLSPTEVRQLLEAARPGFERTLFATAFVTGAREGELLALRWSDLELKLGTGKMYVRRTLSWARLKGEEIRPRYFPPKTKSGVRDVTLPAELVADLKRWKIACPPSHDDLVFPDVDGTPVCRDRMLRCFFPAAFLRQCPARQRRADH